MPNAVPIRFRWRLQLVQHCLPAKAYMGPPGQLLVSASDLQLHGTAASQLQSCNENASCTHLVHLGQALGSV